MTMERISGFEIDSPLGAGLAGPEYLARDSVSGRAVRLLVVARASIPSRQVEQRFIQDALDASSIDHPNMAKIYGVEEADGRILVSCEAAGGETLSNRIGTLSASEAVEVFRGILEGLGAAHEKGVVHGCLSPADVAIAKGGAVKVASFGLANLVRSLPGTGSDTGRSAYLSPEMLQGMEADAASDLWSAGAILYAMLAGRAPFAAADGPSLVYRVLNTDPLSAPAAAGVPADLKPLVGRLLRKDAASRPSSARDALDILDERGRAGRAGGGRVAVGVMYFDHAPGVDGIAHLAVGVSEDLIHRLSHVEGIAVASRQDAVVLRGREVDPQLLGRCMGLDMVMTGSVAGAGDGLRVTARAVDGATGAELWSGALETPCGRAYEIAPRIAAAFLEAAGLEAGEEERRDAAAPITADERAFDFYARGREFLTRRGRRNTEAAIRAFEYALACDPALALAEEGLASACSAMYTYYDGADSWLDAVEAAAGRALAGDARLVEARLHLALVSLHRKDYALAKKGLEAVLRDRPDYYEAYRWLGILSDMRGEFGDAVEYYQKAAAVKPCSVEPWLFINMTHRRRGDLSAAMEAAKKFLEVGIRVLHVAPDDAVTLSRFCPIYTLFGETERARDTLDRILRTGTEDGLVLYNCAATYALLGDADDSLSCLRKALSGGYQNVREWIEGDPDFAAIRDTAAFRGLLSEFDLRHGDDRHDE
jgi:TolB-like protein/Flp pilus assembly protein TadD